MFRFKIPVKNWIFLSRKKGYVTKILKTTFPKEFFHEIRLKVEEHEYNCIFEIKFGKKISLKMAAKTISVTLHNNGHLC